MPQLSAIVAAVCVSLPALLLVGCGDSLPSPSAMRACSKSTDPDKTEVDVFFGCGCFWHMQHAFVLQEMTELCRSGATATARAAYAGGTTTGPDGLVCYHNAENKADYGSLGHAEVVSMSVPESSFTAFAQNFWSLCPGGGRQDPQDMGGEYRSVVGLPGGMQSPLMQQLRAKAGSTQLVAGSGNDGDTQGTGKVFVYDTKSFPAHTAEKYHQFHNDMMASYGDDYNALGKYATGTACPGDYVQSW